MSTWSGRIFSVGAVVVTAISACSGNQAPTPTTPRAIGSVHLSTQGANYIGAESRLLSGFAIGVGRGNIAAGSRVAVSDSYNGVKASAEVWYGKSLETATGFSLDYNSTYTNQSAAKHVRGSGRLFVASIGSVPSLTAAAATPGAGGLLLGGRWQPVTLVAASATNVTLFKVGSDTGGQVAFSGNELTYTDQQGNVAGKHSFDGSDDVENSVKQVMNANVPVPSTNQVRQACQGSASSVANSQIFSLSVVEQNDSSAGGHSSIISVSVSKNAQVDCKTNQATTFTIVYVGGEIDGKGFLAISASPSVPNTAPRDNGPAPPEPQLMNSTIDPKDVTFLPLPILPGGQVPTLDGAYAGSFSGSQTNTDGSSSPVSGTMSVAISGKTVTITAPGSGSGSVDAGGGASFTFVISPEQTNGGTGGTCQFVGIFINSGGAKSASGKMSCTGPGDSLSATWNVAASG